VLSPRLGLGLGLSTPVVEARRAGAGAAQVCKATWRVQTVAVKMLLNTTEKQLEAFRRCAAARPARPRRHRATGPAASSPRVGAAPGRDEAERGVVHLRRAVQRVARHDLRARQAPRSGHSYLAHTASAAAGGGADGDNSRCGRRGAACVEQRPSRSAEGWPSHVGSTGSLLKFP